MKKNVVLIITMSFLSVLAFSSFAGAGTFQSFAIENDALPGSLDYILGTDEGNTLLDVMEQKFGCIDLGNGKTIRLPNAEATLFTAVEKGRGTSGLLWLSVPGKGDFLLGFEASINLLNMNKTFIQLHTVSGKTVALQDMNLNILSDASSFQQFDDAANTMSVEQLVRAAISECDILLILGFLTGGILLIAWLFLCL